MIPSSSLARHQFTRLSEHVFNGIISEICTQRSYRGLLLKMKKALPKFFGFQAVGVLLYDQASKFIFLTL